MICFEMISMGALSESAEQAVEAAVRDLVRARRANGALYVNLPMLYPDGSFVTVRIDHSASGVRVSDAGFAYREADDVGAARSFRRTANRLVEETDVQVGDRLLFMDASIGTLERAICDVAEVSWRVANVISARALEEEDVALSEELSVRLRAIFGDANVVAGADIVGSSTTVWPVTALVTVDGSPIVFQAVSDHANSINRASTAFRDLSTLDKAPRLVAFVRSKAALGSKLALLAPGKIVEEGQGNDNLARAAA